MSLMMAGADIGVLTGLLRYIASDVQLADIRVLHEDLIINFLGLLQLYLEGGKISSSGSWKGYYLRRYR